MVRFTVRGPSATRREDALVLPVFRGTRRLSAGAARIDRAFGGAGALLLSEAGFAGDRGETRVASVRRGRRLVHTVLVGLGEATKITAEDMADAAGAAAKSLASTRAPSAAIWIDDACEGHVSLDAADVAHAVAKAFSLAPYSYRVGTRRPASMRRASIVTAYPAAPVQAALRRAHLLCDWMVRVRDWVNAPPNTVTPSSFAGESRRLLVDHGVTCRVWGRAEIAKAGMGGLLAVASGSREEPRLLVAQWGMAKKDRPLVCLVGKGVTFDSGGISIKPWEKMHEMKSDMAGAANVVAAMAAAAQLDLPVRLVALVPCVENMPGGAAYRPGDVLTLASGRTVEVLTTDAEGRLILSDAVAHARAHYRPDVIVDIATLTGGVLVALGTRMAGIMGNAAREIDDMRAAGDRAGEPVWPLPFDDRFLAMVKGEISDYKNFAGRYASPITGGALIGAFAETTPWVHIDIAGSSWNDGSGASYQSRGATASGIDLLLRYLEIVGARA